VVAVAPALPRRVFTRESANGQTGSAAKTGTQQKRADQTQCLLL
jgi:hypothetical protein